MMSLRGNFVITVKASDVGQRLDRVVSDHLSNCSRSFAATLIQAGHITIDASPKKPSYRVHAGQMIEGCIPEHEPPSLIPEAMALDILFEDGDIIVINKSADIVVHPAPGNNRGTLVNGLLHHCPELGGIKAELRPGIVHRLDKDTTGVIVVAKTRTCLDNLALQFKERQVRKTYLALVHGELKEDKGIIDLPIGRHPVDRKKMSTVGNRGRDAITIWQAAKRFVNTTLLNLDLKTGRTHQIRVHCAAIHHPVVGDKLYSSGKYSKKRQPKDPNQVLLQSVERQMLHAQYLTIRHPLNNRSMTFEAPIPEDMQMLLDGLEQV